MLQVSQREQWYLAFKKCSTRALEYWVIVGGRASTKDARIAQIAGGSRGSEIEPDHMAGDVAAPDPSPAAAVTILFPPRHQARGTFPSGSGHVPLVQASHHRPRGRL